MDAILFIAVHVLLMGLFFIVGIYQFVQIEDKRKRQNTSHLRSKLLIGELDVDESELRDLVRAERYEDAVERLMTVAELDQFTAKSAVETLKKQEFRPYHTLKQDTEV